MAHSHSHLREKYPGRKRAHEMAKHFKRGGKVHRKKADGGVVDKGSDANEGIGDMKPEGKKSGGRLDKFARGGRAGKGKHTNINIVVAPHGPHPAAGAAPATPPGSPPLPPGGGGLPMPPPGAGGPPGMGGGPPGGGLPPGLGKPPGMMKRGGKVKFARGGKIGMTAGADSGEGRLQKAKKYSAK